MTKKFIKKGKKSDILLGEDENHNLVHLDIYQTGHLLMAGVPRSGKSICIHTILTSLILKNSYENLRLVLIDPKQVELVAYKDLPHLAMPILNDLKLILAGLKWINEEIDRRKTIFQQLGISNFEEYERIKKRKIKSVKLPNIVIVADEYADLITMYGQETVDILTSIVQRGSQVGIHLILSTVRPTPDVIFGNLKAFIPTRIAFRVATEIDSKVIIDQAGAENLKGKGDMLLKNEESCIHIQGAYIDEFEVEEICDFIRKKHPSSYLVNLEELEKMKVEIPKEEKEDEELLYQIALFCIERGTTLVNPIQLRFGLGFNRVMEILKELEKRNIISPRQGTKGRTILVDEQKLKEIMDR
ncbi:MAG: FtsK/SpoIIIE domain-containing protein [Roseburia sp.]|nr:FtsK/SpoIIIE domain-containing protein [Anaeroplasma bactoclasticum]MCM1197101.1 FtsK/SpoIIIE domain-containing protein [Roseburia sp.]MCM1556383.1 FtsK/SpoIIIE domain-containing protein [Anaeroplasma bactoclasticum]